jgi:hypothetical protein
MGLDGPRNQFDGEFAALQSRREMESLSTSSVSSVLIKIADAASEFGVPGAGLFAKALKSGQSPVEKVVEQLENGAFAEIARIWRHLGGRDAEFEEFNARLQSQEAQSAYLGAVLHGLRTSDPRKHIRLGTLTINCVYSNDLEPESLDGTMRAAVELNESDISLLGRIYELQVHVIRDFASSDSDRLHRITEDWTARTKLKTENGGIELAKCRGSVARLQAQAFVQLRTPGFDAGAEIAVLLEDGARFYEHLQEIAAT